ncbi:hypothetical protein [Streptosporangium sandarakinum]|uniref:hypothetical protein n=1 Tax=Streptosporangium sandarakinum TaxID=1260955 RepID=UPI0036813FC5
MALEDPRRALTHFAAAVSHHGPYDPDKEARGAVIYLAGKSAARLALGDVDAALESAHEAVGRMGGVDSALGSSTLNELRVELGKHQRIRAVREFLGLTA